MAERQSLLPRLLAGAVLLLLLAVLLQLEMRELIFDAGPAADTQAKPYLAASRFLAGNGVKLDLVSGMAATEQLPDLDTVLVLAARGTLSERRAQGILAWVEQGGHLVLEARSPWNEELGTSANPLLDALGVRVKNAEVPLLGLMDDQTQEAVLDAAWETGSSSKAGQTPSQEPAGSCAMPSTTGGKDSGQPRWKNQSAGGSASSPASTSASTLVAAPVADGVWQQSLVACGTEEQPSYTLVTGDRQMHPLTVDLGWMPLLELADDHTAEPWLSGRNAMGGKLLGIDWGAGTVVLVSSLRQWRNPRLLQDFATADFDLVPEGIGCFDHAHLLRVLVGNASRVLLVHDLDMPHVTVQLVRAVPLVLLTLMLLLGLWLARQLVRPGPVRLDGSSQRRSLQEYVEAGAAFLWRNRDSKGLLGPLQGDVRMYLRQRWPALSADERSAAAAVLVGCDAGQLALALAPDDPLNEQQLLQHTRVLELVRQACADRQPSEDTST